MIKSPNFPRYYLNNNTCSWTISVSTGRTIQVIFNNSFNVAGSPDDCNGDYVQVGY